MIIKLTWLPRLACVCGETQRTDHWRCVLHAPPAVSSPGGILLTH